MNSNVGATAPVINAKNSKPSGVAGILSSIFGTTKPANSTNAKNIEYQAANAKHNVVAVTGTNVAPATESTNVPVRPALTNSQTAVNMTGGRRSRKGKKSKAAKSKAAKSKAAKSKKSKKSKKSTRK